jgi:hypothetical protein
MKQMRTRNVALFTLIFVAVAALLFLPVLSGNAEAKPPVVAPRKKNPRDAGVPEAAPAPKAEARVTIADAGLSTKGEAVETKTLDGGGKIYRFGELEIETRLKSPQLVYFLRRVRAEFAAGDLGHRSFQGELSETREQPGF